MNAGQLRSVPLLPGSPEAAAERRLLILAPIVVFAIPHVFLPLGLYESWMMPEQREAGFIETAVAIFFLLAGVLAAILAFRTRSWQRVLLAGFALAALFVGLEEASYGQHWLGFATPGWFEERNLQNELNLHNLGTGDDHLFGQVIQLAYFGTALVGVVLPLIVRRRPVPETLRPFVPSICMSVPTGFFLFANAPKETLRLFVEDGAALIADSRYLRTGAELEEYMLGLWVLLYIWAVRRRLRQPATDSEI